jgi:hypothetical protein
MMAGFQRYFDYEVLEFCGFPSVTVLGTPAAWRDLQARLEVLREYDAAWWVDPLLPIAEQWVRTAEGSPDLDFWQCLYNAQETYGGELVCGWVCRLYPYLNTPTGPTRFEPTPFVPKKKGVLERLLRPSTSRARWLCSGLTEDSVPSGLSSVPIDLVANDGERRRLIGLAGFLGAAQELGPRGAIFPQVGWAIRDDEHGALWQRLLARGQLVPAKAPPYPSVDFVPALLVELLSLDGQLELDGGALTFATNATLRTDQADCLVFATLRAGGHLVLKEQRVDLVTPGARRLVANSLLELLDRLGRHGVSALTP